MVLVVIIIIACVVNGKGDDEKEIEEIRKSNDSNNISENSQSNMNKIAI